MKNPRVVFIVFGIVVSMFVIAPYVSAQGVWFKGKGSLKGYEVNYQVGTDIIVGKAAGSSNIYVNIVDDTLNNQYVVTTCIEDRDQKGVWHLWPSTILSKSSVYGDPNTAMIWDFPDSSEMNFYRNINTLPMFYVKVNGSLTNANFKSFACVGYDSADFPPYGRMGSCSISFKSIDPAKVPASCAIP
jgi:hypothetical protein